DDLLSLSLVTDGARRGDELLQEREGSLGPGLDGVIDRLEAARCVADWVAVGRRVADGHAIPPCPAGPACPAGHAVPPSRCDGRTVFAALRCLSQSVWSKGLVFRPLKQRGTPASRGQGGPNGRPRPTYDPGQRAIGGPSRRRRGRGRCGGSCSAPRSWPSPRSTAR